MSEKPGLERPAELLRYYVGQRREFIEDWFLVSSRDPRKGLLPFRFNRIQEDYWLNRTERDLVVKTRQVGVSAVVEADYTSLAMLKEDFRVLVIVQKPEEKTVPHHMPRVKGYYYSVPEALRPPLVASNAFSLVFGFGERRGDEYEAQSRIDFISAGSFEAARGGTYHFIHITEFDSYEEAEAEALLQSLLGLPAGARIVIEGSPKRAGGPLHRMWKLAKAGQGTYTPHFYPWFWLEDYTLDDPVLQLQDNDVLVMERLGITSAQMGWRKAKIREAMSQFGSGAEQRFLSEFLEDDIRCWGLAGALAMPWEVIEHLLGQVRAPLPIGMYPDGQNYARRLRLWLLPEPGEAYILFCDPAEGLPTSHDTAVVIRRVRDWSHVGTLVGKVTPEDAGGMMVELARHYNNALVGWERNAMGSAVRAKVVDNLRYRYVYHYKGLHEDEGDERYGFPTNRFTKKDAILAMADFMRHGYFQTWDQQLLEQYRELQDLGNDKYNTGLLDIAMADMLCLQGRAQANRRPGPKPESVSNLPSWMQVEEKRGATPAERRTEARRMALEDSKSVLDISKQGEDTR